jgi:hypothetical protein
MTGRPMSFSPKEVGQHLFAIDLREFAKFALTPMKVEGIEQKTVLTACGELLSRNVECAGND